MGSAAVDTSGQKGATSAKQEKQTVLYKEELAEL